MNVADAPNESGGELTDPPIDIDGEPPDEIVTHLAGLQGVLFVRMLAWLIPGAGREAQDG